MNSLPILLSFLILALSQLFIILFFWRLEGNLKSLFKLFSGRNPGSQPANNLGDEKAWNTLSHAYHQADKIIGEAELEGIRLTAQNRLANEKLTEKYEEEVTIDQKKLEKAFLVEADQAYERFANYLTKMTAQTQKLETAWTAAATKQLATYEKEAEAQVRKELEEYKKARMESLEADIVPLVEKTLRLVLPKAISLKDQTDLVKEALEKAKTEHLL